MFDRIGRIADETPFVVEWFVKKRYFCLEYAFDKYTNEGYGTWRIANFLNDNGYRTRSRKRRHQASIRGILSNLTYTGVLRSGDARSPLLPELQIINPEQFKTASDIFKSRALQKL